MIYKRRLIPFFELFALDPGFFSLRNFKNQTFVIDLLSYYRLKHLRGKCIIFFLRFETNKSSTRTRAQHREWFGNI